MESSQNEATAQHQRDSWAQSAEEARLARLKQLEVMHGYDSDPGLPSSSPPRYATTGTNAIGLANPRFKRELSDEYPRIKREPSEDDILGPLEASLPQTPCPSQRAHHNRTTPPNGTLRGSSQPPNNAIGSLSPAADVTLQPYQAQTQHADYRHLTYPIPSKPPIARRRQKKAQGKKPKLTSQPPVRDSAITVRKKLAASRAKREGRQASPLLAPKKLTKAEKKATRKAKEEQEATPAPVPSDNETVDEEVPHRGNRPRPIPSHQGRGQWNAAIYAYPAISFNAPSGYTTAHYAPQQAFVPQQGFMPQQGFVPQYGYQPYPTYTHTTPFALAAQPFAQPFTWQFPAPPVAMPVAYHKVVSVLTARCQYCGVDIREIERSTGWGLAVVCPVCQTPRVSYPQMVRGQGFGGWF